MASVVETKKIVANIATNLAGLQKRLRSAQEKFDGESKKLAELLQGTNRSVDEEALQAMERASESAEQAHSDVNRAIEACNAYTGETI